MLLKMLCRTPSEGGCGRKTSCYSPRVVLAMMLVSAILLWTAPTPTPRANHDGSVRNGDAHSHVRGGQHGVTERRILNDFDHEQYLYNEQDEFAILELEVTSQDDAVEQSIASRRHQDRRRRRRLSNGVDVEVEAELDVDGRTATFIKTLKELEHKLVIRNMIKRLVEGDNANGSTSTTTTTTQRRVNEVASESETAVGGGGEATALNTGESMVEEMQREVSIEADFWSVCKSCMHCTSASHMCIRAPETCLIYGSPTLTIICCACAFPLLTYSALYPIQYTFHKFISLMHLPFIITYLLYYIILYYYRQDIGLSSGDLCGRRNGTVGGHAIVVW
jgi:hypothetical protein